MRVLILLAVGVAFVAGAFLTLRGADARSTREAEARERSLRQARDQQAATGEILGAIAASPPDLQRVFNAIAESAVRLCEGKFGAVFRVEDGAIHFVAHHHFTPEGLEAFREAYPMPVAQGQGITAEGIRTGRVVHVADIEDDPGVAAVTRQLARTLGYRSSLVVPMLRAGQCIGSLGISRSDARGGPRPFTDREIGLIQTFADQAVIAIENVRLFQELEARNRELTESLEQQTATAEILRVISSTPTDLQPALEAVAESAARLCESTDAIVFRVDGDELRPAAVHGAIGAVSNAISPGFVGGRAVLERRTIHVEDLAVAVVTDFPDAAEHQRRFGHRTTLATPLLREGVPIGAITIRRLEVRPFTGGQVRLLETFASQAVIAIENVLLFQELQARNRELTETLDRQTATSEMLQVISRSPTEIQPVFDAIARSARLLCAGKIGGVFRYEGGLIHLAAAHGMTDEAIVQVRGRFPAVPGDGTLVGRAIRDRDVVNVSDLDSDPRVTAPVRESARIQGVRSQLVVPMLRDNEPIGAVTVSRADAGQLTESHIALLRTFADQAVIAIENVRLFQELEARNRELTETLEQQTATGEILQVISSSPTDTLPVFDAIVRSAGRLGDAAVAMLLRLEGRMIVLEALEGMSEAEMEIHRRSGTREVAPDSVGGRVVLTRRIVQITDVKEDPEYAVVGPLALGYRTALGVPLLREGAAIGAIVLWRREVRPFADKQIQVVRTFADQAVIAIENVRLFKELESRNRELTESLEQQTATSEILRAISASPTDTQPVFDTIAQRAFRVCDGSHCTVFQFDGTLIHLVAHHGQSSGALEVYQQTYPLPPDADTMVARSIRVGAVVHNPDLLTEPSEVVRQISRAGGYRTGVIVPMLRSGRAVGAIGVGRSGHDGGPRPFTEKEIALLLTFADQGVIAVENVRLFRELEMRTRELARSVEELQALSEVGRAVSSTLDLPTVLATIVARAVQLSGTSSGVLYEYDEATQTFQLQASHQTEAEVVEALRASPIQLGEGATGRAVVRRAPVEVVDLLEDQQFRAGLRAILTRLGYRSILSIPLLLEQRILGALTVSRREPGHFPPETVNLLQTFATQSALAIQNARLFREIEAKSRELEVASRHKSQFLANMSHELRTPLNAILGYTELLVDGIYGDLSPKAGDVMTRIDRSGKHLLGLINDVLDLSKIEAGQLELALADYSLTEVVHAVVTQVEALATEKGLILQVAVAPGLSAGRGDERRLAQVLLNLVGNAIKFTEIGSVRVAAYREGDAFVVSVADTGPGIAEADRQRIFEEFQQADSSTTRKKGGTGLGLSIAKRIVELHGGQLWVDSAVARGSTFSFRVPVRVDRQVARS